MKTKIKHLLGAVLVLLGSAITTTAQTPDTRIVFSHDVSGQIYSMNPDGSATAQLTSGGGFWPAWSSDKRYILFNRSTPSENTVYVMEAIGERNGGRIFPVLSNFGGNTGLDWSPDESAIVFEGSAEVGGGLWTVAVNADTGEVGTPVFVRSGPAHAPVWSPDGTRLAFVSNPSGIIKVLDLGTGAESFNVAGYAPSFSPDGSKIAFQGVGPVTKGGRTTWHPQIFAANVDGTGVTQLTSQAWEYVNFPKWSPNGAEIAFWHRANNLNSIRKLTLATGAIALVKKNGQALDWAP